MPTAAYFQALEESKAFHKRNRVWSGKLAVRHAERIKELIEKHSVETILDYGCGKGYQYCVPLENGRMLEEFWGVEVFKYDPAITPETRRLPEIPEDFEVHARLPINRKWDMVICTHVLGAIPIVDLRESVIPDLHRRARKVIYVAENLNPPKKDGFWSTTEDKIRGWSEGEWADLLRRESDVELSLWFRGGPNGDGALFRRWDIEAGAYAAP